MKGRVVIVAGSDPCGGAGLQADIKTATALGAYSAAVVTALSAQNTMGIYGTHPVAPGFVAQQLRLVLDDIGADVIKTGFLGDADGIDAVMDLLEEKNIPAPIVCDPMIVPKDGSHLQDMETIAALKRRLIVHTTVLAPNIPEAEVLIGMEIKDMDTMRHAAEMLMTLGPKAVFLKGARMEGERIVDLLVTDAGEEVFETPRIEGRNTHGVGTTLTAAIATGLAQGFSIRESVVRARAYTHAAILKAPNLGAGYGPLNHIDAADDVVCC